VVRELIQAGANVNLAMNDGATPAYVASQNGHTDVLALLLKNGADVNLAVNDGRTPAHIASQSGYTDVLAILQEKGADVNASSSESEHEFHVALLEPGHSRAYVVLPCNPSPPSFN
jgi:ankyrin repeat protein